jgi:hypothetical protein
MFIGSINVEDGGTHMGIADCCGNDPGEEKPFL